jgi:hypothetical protein
MVILTILPLIPLLAGPWVGDAAVARVEGEPISVADAADDRSQCDSDCGRACTKKEWCGSNTCEPWPNYCWKC